MSDNYQAVYDAVRSRFHCDPQSAIESVLRDAFGNADRHMFSAMQYVTETADMVANEQKRPSVLFHPKIYSDGNQWCVRYGDDLQSGVAGFGDTPAAAMSDFDANWIKPLAIAAEAGKGLE